ncbi:MAG: DegV family protein [Eubacterium sp.]|nr:DegV family protein [Eubacterium sp.]
MIRIVSDSTCDLSEELLTKYNVEIIPLFVRMGDDERRDGVDVTIDELYKWSDENNTTPQTAAPSIEDVADVLKKYKEAGDDVIVFTVSASMSSSNQVVKLAADSIDYEDHVYAIDSMNLSTGIGLQIIEAAQEIEKGRSFEEVISYIEDLREKVRASFVVDTLTYLHRGGRCSATAALVGSMLKIKPKIVVEDGKMDASKKYRGPLKRVLLQYVDDMKDELLKAKPERVFITHSTCKPEIVDVVREYLENLDYFEEIIETKAGSVISSHCGPGCLGVLFIDGE